VTPSRRWLAPASLIAFGLLFFGAYAPKAGLHLDDYSFLWNFTHYTRSQLLQFFRYYVPGRNLYIPLFYLLQKICGDSPAAMHLFGLGLDLLNPVLVFALSRRLNASRGSALAAAGLFLAWPNHGETHWWTSAILMNLLTTSLVLGAFLLAGDLRLKRATRLSLAAVLYAIALFDYDQVFFLWIPLLAFYRFRDPDVKPRPLAAVAAGFFLLDTAHFSLRMLGRLSLGGRPTPRADVFLHSVAQAAAQTLFPFPVRHRPVLSDFPGGLPAALVAAGLIALAWTALCARTWNENEPTPPADRARPALFGAAWWLFAYAPNFFWYISPRHNYLPSVGTAIVAATLARQLSLRPKARPFLAAAGAAFFALSALYAWSDGAAWAASTSLHERFGAEAARALPPGAEAVFLVGAPTNVRSGPGFHQPLEHLHALARASGKLPLHGDVSIAPNRRGLFYCGQIKLFGDSAPPCFVDAKRATVFAWLGDGKFERVCALGLSSPGLATRNLLVGSESCPARLGLEVPVALVDSKSGRSTGPTPQGPTLASAEIAAGPRGTFDLTLVWIAGAATAYDFASYPVLFDAAGRVLYRSAYEPSPREHEALWPLFNDAQPPSTWKQGRMITERYRLKRPQTWGSAPVRLKLALFKDKGWENWDALPPQEVELKTP